jgi:hypothetical protein
MLEVASARRFDPDVLLGVQRRLSQLVGKRSMCRQLAISGLPLSPFSKTRSRPGQRQSGRTPPPARPVRAPLAQGLQLA